MKMIRHLTAGIDFVLKMSDKALERCFELPAAEIREDLLERKAKGEMLIPSDGCEGFCPINGCPGHEVKD